MGFERNYGGIIFTTHALQRLRERGVTQEQVWHIIKHPENRIAGKNPGTTEYQKIVGNSIISVITKFTDKGENLVVSVIVEPPLPGTFAAKQKKYYHEYKNAPWWKKFLLVAKKQLGF